MATAKKTTEPVDAGEETEQAAEQLAAGTLIRHADDTDRLALLVGYTEDGHPQLVDLPGVREHQPGVVRA